jgi:hypothetical protein
VTIHYRKPSTFFTLVVMLLCVWGMYHAVRMGVADVIAYQAKFQLKSWDKEARLPTAEEAEYALAKASSALVWQPDNAELLELKAHVLTYQALLYRGDEAFLRLSAEAIMLYQQATLLRPKWPYAWANLALLKAYQGEFDPVYNEAVAKAVAFGPWEPGVHKTLARAGLLGWSQLDPTTKNHHVGNIHRGLRFSAKAITQMAARYQNRDQVCAFLPKDKYTRRFCGW